MRPCRPSTGRCCPSEPTRGRGSNYASATYVESTNEIGVAYDGNRRILNDYEIRSLFPGTGSYPAGATAAP